MASFQPAQPREPITTSDTCLKEVINGETKIIILQIPPDIMTTVFYDTGGLLSLLVCLPAALHSSPMTSDSQYAVPLIWSFEVGSMCYRGAMVSLTMELADY